MSPGYSCRRVPPVPRTLVNTQGTQTPSREMTGLRTFKLREVNALPIQQLHYKVIKIYLCEYSFRIKFSSSTAVQLVEDWINYLIFRLSTALIFLIYDTKSVHFFCIWQALRVLFWDIYGVLPKTYIQVWNYSHDKDVN